MSKSDDKSEAAKAARREYQREYQRKRRAELKLLKSAETPERNESK